MFGYTLCFSVLAVSYVLAKSEIVAPPSTSVSSFSQRSKQNVEPIPQMEFEEEETQDVVNEEAQPFESPSNPSTP